MVTKFLVFILSLLFELYLVVATVSILLLLVPVFVVALVLEHLDEKSKAR